MKNSPSWMAWSLWLLPMAIYFSLTTGLWHTYYLIMLGPGIAALAGMCVWSLGNLFERNHWTGWIATLVFVGSTLVYELVVLNKYMTPYGWLIELIILLALTGFILAALKTNWARPAAFGLLAFSLALAPLSWSLAGVLDGGSDSNLPNSGPGDRNKPNIKKTDTLNVFQHAVLEYTLANTSADDYLLVGLSSNQTAPYILATGRPVLAIGGFSGNDDIFTKEELVLSFQSGELRFVLMSQELTRQYTEFAEWVTDNCQVVPLPGLPTPQINRLPRLQAYRQQQGLPQTGTNVAQVDELYDCGR